MDFEFERQYRCLECAGETILNGKIRAHAHITACHSHLLAKRHVDELLEELPQQMVFEFEFDQDAILPPYHCLFPSCHACRPTEAEIRLHIKVAHDFEQPELGHHFEDEGARHARARAFEVRLNLFSQTIESIETVADFLTECDA